MICLMRIGSRSRKLIAIFDAVLVFASIFSAFSTVLLKLDKILEFYNFGIFTYFYKTDPFLLYTYLIVGALLSISIYLLIHVFDVTISQNSHYHVEPNSYSTPIYLLLISLLMCSISCALSMRLSLEFDEQMGNLMMKSYLKYEKSKEARLLVDRIHMEYECCGVNSIDDLMDLSEVDTSLAPKTQLWSCNEWEYCGVPLSCCKSIECSQKVQFLSDGWEVDVIKEKWFWKRGCVAEMDNSFLFFNFPEHAITDFLLVLLVGLHVCSLVLTQILVTASATWHGAKLGPLDSSYAWLLDVGKPDMRDLIKILNPDLKEEVKSENVSGDSEGQGGETNVETEAETEAETGKATETEKVSENPMTERPTTEKGGKLLGALVKADEMLKENGKAEISTKQSDQATTEKSNDKSTDKTLKKPAKTEKPAKKKVEKSKNAPNPKKKVVKKKEAAKKSGPSKNSKNTKNTKKKSTAKKGKKK